MKNIIKTLKHYIAGTKAYQLYSNYKKREHLVHNGEMYPDKTFYIIGQDDLSGGMWWLINKVVMHIAYARERGYTPVVDLQNYWTQYTSEDTFGKINIWELFLKQPCEFSLDDISCAKNVIICKKAPAPLPKYLMGNNDFYEDNDRLKYFKDFFKQYIRFNSETLNYFKNQEVHFFKGRRMCGVLCRGTDYVAQRPKNHPVQPRPEDVINDVKRVVKDYNCDGVFIATEDQDILDSFKSAFGDKLAFIDQPRLSKSDLLPGELLAKSKQRLNISKSSIEDGRSYLLSTYLLSRCCCFLSGRTGGCKGVLLMSDSFDYCYIYNLGLYS